MEQRKYLRSRQVRQRYGDISHATLWRHIRDGCLPPPDAWIKGQRLWRGDKLDLFDREHLEGTA